jgi:hypothetical protein
MARRCRHLNPGHLGARQAFDARFITGATNNSGFSPWVDRTGFANATQATGGNRPLYIANGVNGQPSVRFNTTPLYFTHTSVTVNNAFTSIAVSLRNAANDLWLAAGNEATSLNYQVVRHAPDSKAVIGIDDAGARFLETGTTYTAGVWTISTVQLNGDGVANAFGRRNGGSAETWTLAQSVRSTYNGMRYGCLGAIVISNTVVASSSGDIGAVCHFQSGTVSQSVMKRIEHSYAYSFKLPCS